MGNSPEICRKHYAALIPEEMAEVVEFETTSPEDDPTDDAETKALLKELLHELKGTDDHKPRIRLVR